MASASSAHHRAAPLTPVLPGFRLRHLLGLALLGACALWIVPRGRATWALHNQAVLFADYALCMVGPTGPDLLQNDPAGFRELVRRRVVASMPQDTPLLGCESFAEKIGLPHASYKLHSAMAGEFAEYKNTPHAGARVELGDLDLSLARLQTLSDDAWPFVRTGFARLMVPSSHAKEAQHSLHVPRPGRGSGLPASRHLYRSTSSFGDLVVVSLGSGANARTLISRNAGVDWTAGGGNLASEIRDRCVVDNEGRAFTISRTNDGQRIVISQGPDAAPQLAVLSKEQPISGIACDESSLVATLVGAPDAQGERIVSLRICPFQRPCRDLATPDMGGDKLYYPVDIARVGGDTIVARTSQGITRVSSSRDDGRTWTPWTVAYDRAAVGSTEPAPFRLLVAGGRVLLYSGAEGSGNSYPLLVSDDHGASFHAADVSGTGTEAVVATADKFD